MKFITIADWTGMVETELFAQTYKSYGLTTIRYRVLEITAIVEPYENGRGFSLRVQRVGKARTREKTNHPATAVREHHDEKREHSKMEADQVDGLLPSK